MLEKRNKRLFIQLVVLIVATLAIYWLGKGDNAYQINKNLFRDYDFATVDQIILKSNQQRVVLTYNGSRWKVNDQYNADPNMIDLLFATMQQAEPKRPVASSLKDSVNSSLEQRGIHVSLFSKGNIAGQFMAGGDDAKSQTYFKNVSSDTPYIVTIPGYRVYVSGIFEIPESGWRDKYVFGFNWENFKNLKTVFPDPKNNFTVAMNKNFFGIQEVPKADTTKLNNFLDAVSLLTVDSYINSDEQLDSLSKTSPLVEFIVQDIGNKEYRLKIFKGSQPEDFVGFINEAQWATFTHEKIRAVIRPKQFFTTP
jgi:hypothetical protein